MASRPVTLASNMKMLPTTFLIVLLCGVAALPPRRMHARPLGAPEVNFPHETRQAHNHDSASTSGATPSSGVAAPMIISPRRLQEIIGDIYTIAGSSTGGQGLTDNGGPATSALLNNPYGVAYDSMGNLAFTDMVNAEECTVNAGAWCSDAVALVILPVYLLYLPITLPCRKIHASNTSPPLLESSRCVSWARVQCARLTCAVSDLLTFRPLARHSVDNRWELRWGARKQWKRGPGNKRAAGFPVCSRIRLTGQPRHC